MQTVFIGCWCVALASFIYANIYWLPMWAAGFKKKDHHKGYMRKALTGFGMFILACLVGILAGVVADVWGGGWGA